MSGPEDRRNQRTRTRLFASERASLVWEWVANLALVGIYLRLAFAFGSAYLETPRLSSLLVLIAYSLLAFLFLTRRQARVVSADPLAWAVALAGTWTPLLLNPEVGDEVLLGQVMQVAGLALQVAGILSLARSFGIVAANRGIQTGGPYRVVRHPLYTAYFLSNAGFLVNQFSVYNAIVLLVWAFFQLHRVRYEEQLLSQDSEYREFMKSTRWRLFPFVY